MRNRIAIISMLIMLGLVNWSIAGKEKHLAEGQLVYLGLVPVDPRSLMQGDYMALRFRIVSQVRDALPKTGKFKHWERKVDATDGYVIVELNQQNIASFESLYTNQMLGNNEILLRYRVRNNKVKFASNAFFFQEGQGKDYQTARYGQFRVDDKGELLLVAMVDKGLVELGRDK